MNKVELQTGSEPNFLTVFIVMFGHDWHGDEIAFIMPLHANFQHRCWSTLWTLFRFDKGRIGRLSLEVERRHDRGHRSTYELAWRVALSFDNVLDEVNKRLILIAKATIHGHELLDEGIE